MSAAGLVVLDSRAIEDGKPTHLVGFTIYGLSAVALYTASALYHTLPLPAVGISRLRRLDHMMIYVLIAGTYTPICLVVLQGALGWIILGLSWILCVVGIAFKARSMHSRTWVSPVLYLGMGWLGVTVAPQAYDSLGAAGMAWIVAGGVVYTVGAIILGLGRPNPWPGRIGAHELWHVFVLAGSACYFWVMARYVAPLR